MRAHNDAEYKAFIVMLRNNPQPCQLKLAGCTGLATTPDHQPRVAEHTHVRGTRCCSLIPACHHCNSSDGATAGNRKRASGYSWP